MPKINATRLAKMRSLSMEISMTTSTKYCATAIICTLIIAAAYMITNRYEAAPNPNRTRKPLIRNKL